MWKGKVIGYDDAEGINVRYEACEEGDDGYECWIDIDGEDEWRWLTAEEAEAVRLEVEGKRLPPLAPGYRAKLLAGMHEKNKSGRLPNELLGIALDAALSEVELTGTQRLNGEWQVRRTISRPLTSRDIARSRSISRDPRSHPTFSPLSLAAVEPVPEGVHRSAAAGQPDRRPVDDPFEGRLHVRPPRPGGRGPPLRPA